MNPETSVTKAQIERIFTHHGLADKPKIRRIEIGFTNEVHQVDNYILKIAVRKNWSHKFNNEVEFYQKLAGMALVPTLLVVDESLSLIDKPYMIYQMIPGQSLGGNWHKISDEQRKETIRQICLQLRIIADLEPNPELKDGCSWQQEVLGELAKDLKKIADEDLLPAATQQAIKDYIKANQQVLVEQKLSLFYWDINLDNIICDDNYQVVGIIDMEHVSVVSLDYPMEIVRVMMNFPWKHQTLENEKYAKKADYAHLIEWYQEFYPEMFDFKDFEKRLDIYELEAILRQRHSWPKEKTSIKRLQQILSH